MTKKIEAAVSHYQREIEELRADRDLAAAYLKLALQSLDDPNDITVVHAFKHLDDARAFIASNELAQTMNDAGVLGKPQIWLTEER